MVHLTLNNNNILQLPHSISAKQQQNSIASPLGLRQAQDTITSLLCHSREKPTHQHYYLAES